MINPRLSKEGISIPRKGRLISSSNLFPCMQFDNENASDSIDLKDLAGKEINETEKAELSGDTTGKTEAPVIENKEVVKSQPIDATKRGATRTKKVRQ